MKPCSGCGQMREHVVIGGITLVGCETCVSRDAVHLVGLVVENQQSISAALDRAATPMLWVFPTANHDPGDEDVRR